MADPDICLLPDDRIHSATSARLASDSMPLLCRNHLALVEFYQTARGSQCFLGRFHTKFMIVHFVFYLEAFRAHISTLSSGLSATAPLVSKTFALFFKAARIAIPLDKL
jgi:hypothetical protein